MGADASKKAKGSNGAAGDAVTRKASLVDRVRRRGRGSTSGSSAPEAAPQLPTVEEALLAKRLAEDSSGPQGPPFYAVGGAWLAAWNLFVTGGGPPPGPIFNTELVAASETPPDVVWLNADDWHLVHKLHGGGPVLCRPVRTLSLQLGNGEAASDNRADAGDGLFGEGPTSGSIDHGHIGGSSSGVQPTAHIEVPLRRAMAAHAQRCRTLEQEMAAQVQQFERGAWARRNSKKKAEDPIPAARERLSRALATSCGGEELREALQALRAVGGDRGANLEPLDASVAEMCKHEEAQIVLACLLQAVEQADRLGLELWLEQATAMDLDVFSSRLPPSAAGTPSGSLEVLGPLAGFLAELEEREKRVLVTHSANAEERNEGPAERTWRLSMSAYEAGDEATLMDLADEARSIGIDSSGTHALLEELRERRFAANRASAAAARRAGGYAGRGGGASWNASGRWTSPGTGGEPDWNDPSSWRDTDGFLGAYRRWKHEERQRNHGPEAAERMRREDDEARRRWDEEERLRRNEEEAERARRFQAEEQKRRQQEREWRSAYASRGAAGGWRGYGAQYNYSGGGSSGTSYGGGSAGYGGYQPPGGGGGYARPPPSSASSASLNIGGTAQQLSLLGLPPGRVPPLPALKAAYRKAAMNSHPDRPQNKDRQAEATAEFQRVKAAFDALAAQAPESC